MSVGDSEERAHLAQARVSSSTELEWGDPGSFSDRLMYGQRFYPTVPLSWLAPLWFFACGAAGSGGWAWTSGHVLRLLTGFLLAGPLLGLVWAASTRLHSGRLLVGSVATVASANDGTPGTLRALPYTLPGSPGHRLMFWLSETSHSWRQALARQPGRPVLEGVVASVFALTLAAQTGRQSLALTAVFLCTALVRALVRGRWASSQLLSLAFPLLAAWLLGHAAYGNLSPFSTFVALCLAIAMHCLSALYRQATWSSQGLLWQGLAVASLILLGQPVAAAATALLATCQVLLSPLLQTARKSYFRAIQSQLLLSTFLTALALGYRP